MIGRSFENAKKVHFYPTHKCKLFVPDSVFFFCLCSVWVCSCPSLSLLRSLSWRGKIYRCFLKCFRFGRSMNGFFSFCLYVGTRLSLELSFDCFRYFGRMNAVGLTAFLRLIKSMLLKVDLFNPVRHCQRSDSCLSDAVSTATKCCCMTEGRRTRCTTEGNDIRRNKSDWLSDNDDIVCINSLNFRMPLCISRLYNVYIWIMSNYLKLNDISDIECKV